MQDGTRKFSTLSLSAILEGLKIKDIAIIAVHRPMSRFRVQTEIKYFTCFFTLACMCEHKYHLMTILMQLHCFDAPLRQSIRSQVVHNISTETSI